MKLVLLSLISLVVCVQALRIPSSIKSHQHLLNKNKKTSLNAFSDVSMITSLLRVVGQSEARVDFWFFFFGGSGALGIGGAQIPKILKELDEIKALGGKPSLGGPELDISPLATIGYPEPLRIQDLESIFQNLPDLPTLLSKGDKKTYMSQLGYVEQVALGRSLPDANPLAMRSLYDAVSGGGGGGVMSPAILTQKLAIYRESGGIEAFKTDLFLSSLKKSSAYVIFVLLIALVFDLVIESGMNAFL